MSDMRTKLVDATAAAWLGLAAAGTISPDFVIGVFGGQKVTSPSYRGELRAVYTGMGLAYASALAWANRDRPSRRAVLRTIGFSHAGIAAGRLSTALLDDGISVWPNGVFAATELAMAALLLTS